MIALVDTKGHRIHNSSRVRENPRLLRPETSRNLGLRADPPRRPFQVLEAAREARTTDAGKSLQYRLRHKTGSWRILESTASTIKNAQGEVEKMVIVNGDVTQRVEAEERLAHNALHDALTGLPNRRLFLDRLQRCFAQAQRDPHLPLRSLAARPGGLPGITPSAPPRAIRCSSRPVSVSDLSPRN
jgi:hypothetical protein